MARRAPKGIKRKVLFIAFAIVVIFLVYKIGIVSYQKYQISQEISNIDGELKALSAKSEDLKALKRRLSDSAYLEKEARKKLNFQKEGEKAVIIVGGSKSTIKNKESQKDGQKEEESNLQKWFTTLFGK